MVRVIQTESCYVIIDKENNRVQKIFRTYWMRKCPWLIGNEVRALKKLDSKHFPKLLDYDENSITTTYAGKSIFKIKKTTTDTNSGIDAREFTEMPEDFNKQVEEILNELEDANLRHSDINSGHLLINKGVVMLIDFELCLEKNEREPKNYPKTMGIELKIRSIEEPVDDRLMAKRTINWLNGGLEKIQELIKKNGLLYHELPFRLDYKADRGFLKQRIEMMKAVYDFKGKKGLDLGCNIGGVTFSLAMEGAEMIGVELLEQFVELANACEDYYCLNTKFVNENIVDYVNKLPECFETDFCILLAIWHWILFQEGLTKATKLLKTISEKCEVMFIETNFGFEKGLTGSGDAMIKAGITDENKLIEFIKKNTNYTKVEKIGNCIGWNNRPTFMCSK